MQLVIGNKNYSSWSMRPWVLMRHFELPFDEVMLRFDFGQGSQFSAAAVRFSPTARVPVLVEDDGFATWDSLAIAERLAELFPQHPVWPRDAKQRAQARSMAASMHSGFGELRRLCPMNIDCDLQAVGRRLLASEPSLFADLTRLEALWEPALQAHGGPYLFGREFGAVDAYFAPVAMRVSRYGLPLGPEAAAYMGALEAHEAVRAWVAGAMDEKCFVPEDEPYRGCASELPR
jgi:glutathione S-transferase